MKSRELLYGKDARTKLKTGVDALANMVKVTLGPSGRNVIIDKYVGPPLITKDGVTVAKEVFLKDQVLTVGANFVREVASKTAESAGDGTTTAIVLAQAIIQEGIKSVEFGANPILIKKGMELAKDSIIEYLKTQASPIESIQDIENVATISTNNDSVLGKLVADAVSKAGDEGVIVLGNSPTSKTYVEVTGGSEIGNGYASVYFITNTQRGTAELENVSILLCADPLQGKDFTPGSALANILDQTVRDGKAVLIVAADFDQNLMNNLVANKVQHGAKLCAVKAPGYQNYMVDVLKDIEVLVGGKVVGDRAAYPIKDFVKTDLGGALRVIVTKDKTTIVGAKGTLEDIQRRVDEIKAQISTTVVTSDIQKMNERKAKLLGGVCILQAGGATEAEVEEKKMRLEDALHATRAAIQEGVVPGGGVALLRASLYGEDTPRDTSLSEDELLGIKILHRAIRTPFKIILDNAGLNSEEILAKIKEDKSNSYGLNVRTNVYGDLVKMGVVDPLKVVRLALENAVSIGSLFLTTEGAIIRSEEELLIHEQLLNSLDK